MNSPSRGTRRLKPRVPSEPARIDLTAPDPGGTIGVAWQNLDPTTFHAGAPCAAAGSRTGHHDDPFWRHHAVASVFELSSHPVPGRAIARWRAGHRNDQRTYPRRGYSRATRWRTGTSRGHRARHDDPR